MPKKSKIPNAKRVLNIIPSRDTDKDWRYEDAAAVGLAGGPAAAFPASKDLRPTGWWGIRDQGLTGACVGFATADSVLRWHFGQAGRLGKTDASRDMLTPRFTWDGVAPEQAPPKSAKTESEEHIKNVAAVN